MFEERLKKYKEHTHVLKQSLDIYELKNKVNDSRE